MGMVRLRPIALTLMIGVLSFTVTWLGEPQAEAAKIVAPASSSSPDVGGKSPGFSSHLVAVKPRTNSLKSRKPVPAKKNPESNSSQTESSQGNSQSVTIEKKSAADFPSDPGDKYPTYKNNNPDLT
ncbi:MAG: hypothetical protein ACP5U1_16490, partial [Desulfomonilaceae bacterium]